MKTGLLATSAIVLAQLAAAQPHGHRHLHQRDVAEVTTTVVMPEVVVYVDEQGNTIGAETKAPVTTTTTTSTPPPPSSTPTTTSTSTTSNSPIQAYVPSSSSSSSEAPAPTTTTTQAPKTSAAPTSAAPASTSAASSGSSSGSSSGYSGSLSSAKGATYSPYNDDGSCKGSSTVSSDIATLAGQGFNAIRIYGVDCNQVANVVPACKSHGMGVIAGLFNIGSVTSDLGSMSSQLGADFSGVSAVTVYNEPLNNGQLGPSDVASAIQSAKSFLKSTNFAGGVAAVDTFNQLLLPANKAVIDASDFVAANCHAWFDTTCEPSGAGSFVQNSCVAPLQAIAGGKEVVITESGWPSQSPSGGMGANIASSSAQSTAVGQLRSMSGLFAFSYFSTAWHKSPSTVENFWGWSSS